MVLDRRSVAFRNSKQTRPCRARKSTDTLNTTSKIPLPELNDREQYVFDYCVREVDKLTESHGPIRLIQTEMSWRLKLSRAYEITGTCDLIIWFYDDTMHVVDYKAGFLDVSHAWSNLQLWTYMLSGLQRLATDSIQFRRIMEDRDLQLFGHILQPFSRHRHSTVQMFPEDIDAIVRELKSICKASRSKNAKRTVGIDQCRWCRAKGTDRCPESRILFRELPVLRSMETSPTIRDGILQACSVAKNVIEQVRVDAKSLLMADPEAIAGWVITDPIEVPTVTNIDAAWRRLQDIGFTAEQFSGCLSFRMPEAIAVVMAKDKDLSERDARRFILATLQDAVTVTERAGHLKYQPDN